METFTQLFSGTALLALLTYLGYQLKEVPKLIYDQIRKKLIYSVHIEETSELFLYFEKWLLVNHERSFKNVRAFLSTDSNGTPKNEEQKNVKENLIFHHYSDIFILKYKNKRLIINKGREKFENASDIRNAFYNNFKIEGWFAKDTVTKLLKEVVDYNNSIKETKQYIYVNNIYNDWTRFGEIHGKSISNIVLKDKQKIVNNIVDFTLKEAWYFVRGLSYKRDYLFYGPPGNGKTSLCLALANHFNKDVYFLNLNDLEKDNSLFITFNNMRKDSILVIEDVDSIFGSREEKAKISFSALLNCLDGAFSKHGVITIMTTNHIEKLDPALIREGRIDVKVYIDNPNKDLVEEYLSIFYNQTVKLDKYEGSLSMSKIQEICLLNKDCLSSAIHTLNNLVNKEENVLA